MKSGGIPALCRNCESADEAESQAPKRLFEPRTVVVQGHASYGAWQEAFSMTFSKSEKVFFGPKSIWKDFKDQH